MPPYEVAAILRSTGFLPLGGPVRRGGFYVVAAVHPRGEEGRVVIDAYHRAGSCASSPASDALAPLARRRDGAGLSGADIPAAGCVRAQSRRLRRRGGRAADGTAAFAVAPRRAAPAGIDAARGEPHAVSSTR